MKINSPTIRWWLRTRKKKDQSSAPAHWEGRIYIMEFYIPWWAWPFEIGHRLIFGKGAIRAACGN